MLQPARKNVVERRHCEHRHEEPGRELDDRAAAEQTSQDDHQEDVRIAHREIVVQTV